MSAFATQWDAKIAPIGEERVMLDLDTGRYVRETWSENAIRGAGSDTRVLVNHDARLHVGYVDVFFAHAGWHWASFRLDRSLPGSEVVAEYLELGWPVSLGGRSHYPIEVDGSVYHHCVKVEELSLVGAGARPVYRDATIVGRMQFSERGAKPKPRAAPPREPGELEPGRVIVRHGIGQVLGVR